MEENLEFNELMTKLSCVALSVLKSWKMILFVMVIFGIGCDVFKTMTYVPQYQASLKATLTNENNSYDELEKTLSYIKSLNYIFNGQVAQNYVSKQIGADHLDLEISVKSIHETNLVEIVVIAPSRQQAFYSLNELIEWYDQYFTQYHFSYQLDVVEKHSLVEQPIHQNKHTKNFALGSLISGTFFVLVLGLFEFFKDTIYSIKEVQNKVDACCIAKIPFEKKPRGKFNFRRTKKAILITSLKTSFSYQDSIKKCRHRLEKKAKKHGYQTFMITSSLENEGKSTITTNLAISLAQKGHRVLLIDLDLRKPALHKIFELHSKKTINSYFEGQSTWQNQVIHLKKIPSLDLLCANVEHQHAEEILNGERLTQLLQDAKKNYEYILIDSSPTYPVLDSVILNEKVDASLLVIKQNQSNAKIVNQVISRLVHAKNNVIGCIYIGNDIKTKKKEATSYRYEEV